MTRSSEVIQSSLSEILSTRKDVTLMACQQRAKFEGWLKFELASALARQQGFRQVILEDGYADGGRSDISYCFEGVKWQVEMKTANTNWREEGLEALTRPVTRNMDGIIEDVLVLRRKSAPARGIAVFCIFPVPERLWKNTREQLNFHLRRIEQACQLPVGALTDNATYIETTSAFGICTFIIEVS